MGRLNKTLVAVASVVGLGFYAATRKANAAELPVPDDVDDDAGDTVDDGPLPGGIDPGDLPKPPMPLDPFGDLPPPPDPGDAEPRKPKHIGHRGDDGPLPDIDPGDAEPRKPKHIGHRGDDGPATDPSDDGPAWTDLLATYPRGARFFQVLPNDRFGGTNGTRSIAYRFLLSEAYLAAKEFGGLSDDEARVWALAVAKQDKLRAAVIDEIQCSGWNDAAYGQAPKKGTHTSKHGRAILLTPMHGPNAALLEQGAQPFRNVTLTGGLGNPAYRHLECLWLMPISRRRLWEDEAIVTDSPDLVWADGTSMQNPPPWVMQLGMGDESGDLHGDFGCPGSDGELGVE